MVSHPEQTISLKHISELVGLAYVRAFSPSNITKGFSTTGIYSFNPHIFEDIDFAGAEVTNKPYQEVGQNPEKGDPTAQQESPDLDDPTAQPGTSSSQQESPDIDNPTAQPGTSSSLQKSTSNAIRIPQLSQSPHLLHLKVPKKFVLIPRHCHERKKVGRKPGRTRILTDTPEKAPS
ncbi:hypothetical protein JTB14_025050 [Gonioctena quinquepunctata]|nr:hypothetical protein JTB14_025050 [Gonioctena quinquepunctata]